MVEHRNISGSELRKKLRRKDLIFGGNKIRSIYGNLHCLSGKRMKRENRIFFVSEDEAKAAGYRPCGHCMKQEYQHWKHTHGSV
jgi:methylphosphotriester-DNA--protein-cysteine methyltransferase